MPQPSPTSTGSINWYAYALVYPNGKYHTVYKRKAQVRLWDSSTPPVPVIVTLTSPSAEGDYWGWQYTGHYDTLPRLIQSHPQVFDMQFPNGAREHERKGHGRIVRLRITEREE